MTPTHEKNAYRYYMFKNDQRSSKLKSQTKFLNVFFFIALFTFILAIAMFIVVLILWLITPLLTLWFVFGYGADNPFSDFLNISSIVIYVNLGIFVLLFILKFYVEWFHILAETKELKTNEKANQKRILLAKAIIDVKICGLFSTLILLGSIAAPALTVVLQVPANVMGIVFGACVLVAIIAAIWKNVYCSKRLAKVHDIIYEIREKENLHIR